MPYELWQWVFFAIAAIIIGMSKCGIPGLGILNVAIFQNVLLAKDATGFGLPLLVVGDFCAVIAFRKHADWKQVLGLIPFAAVGVIVGFFVLGSIDNAQARLLIGASLVIMIVLYVANRRSKAPKESGLLLGASADDRLHGGIRLYDCQCCWSFNDALPACHGHAENGVSGNERLFLHIAQLVQNPVLGIG